MLLNPSGIEPTQNWPHMWLWLGLRNQTKLSILIHCWYTKCDANAHAILWIFLFGGDTVGTGHRVTTVIIALTTSRRHSATTAIYFGKSLPEFWIYRVFRHNSICLSCGKIRQRKNLSIVDFWEVFESLIVSSQSFDKVILSVDYDRIMITYVSYNKHCSSIIEKIKLHNRWLLEIVSYYVFIKQHYYTGKATLWIK